MRLKKKRKGTRKRMSHADFMRSWGLHPKTYQRYSGIKGIYWTYFSRMIRARDYAKFGGLCMTCLRFVKKGDGQCGHFFPAANCGFELLFHPMNNHLQHSACNNPRFTPQAGIYNTLNLVQRYGTEIVSTLERIKSRPNQKEWNKERYIDELKKLGVEQRVEEL